MTQFGLCEEGSIWIQIQASRPPYYELRNSIVRNFRTSFEVRDSRLTFPWSLLAPQGLKNLSFSSGLSQLFSLSQAKRPRNYQYNHFRSAAYDHLLTSLELINHHHYFDCFYSTKHHCMTLSTAYFASFLNSSQISFLWNTSFCA